jgi:hypothetical protein
VRPGLDSRKREGGLSLRLLGFTHGYLPRRRLTVH